MERIAIAMQDGGTGAGAQHGGAGPEANLILSCHRTSMWAPPPVGGTFWFQIFIQAPSPEIWSETISGNQEGPGGEMGWPVFGLPPWKKFSAANFVGCTTGKSAGCSPLRMRPV